MSNFSFRESDEDVAAFSSIEEEDQPTESDNLLQNASGLSSTRVVSRRPIDVDGRHGSEVRHRNSVAVDKDPSYAFLHMDNKLSRKRHVALPPIELRGVSAAQHGGEQKSTRISATPVPQSTSPLQRLINYQSETIPVETPITSATKDLTQQAKRPQARSTRTGKSTKSVKQGKGDPNTAYLRIKVFFCDDSYEEFNIAGGRKLEAQVLLEHMAKRLSVDNETFQEACSLWFISRYLEIQLKPYHVPWNLYTCWNRVLERFTYEESHVVRYDKPKLVCKRSAGLGLRREREITERFEIIGHILYIDARDEYLNARYLLNGLDDAVTLAALHLAIHKDEDVYTTKDRRGKVKQETQLEWVSNHVSKCCPIYRIPRMRSWFVLGFNVLSCFGMHHEVCAEFERWYAQKEKGNHYLKMQYLEVLRKTPFYGAAYFDAQIELRSDKASALFEPRRRFWSRNGDDALDVKVAINRQYITILDLNRHEILLCQQIIDCRWKHMMCIDEYSKSTRDDAQPDIPCLLLHFPCKDDLQKIVDSGAKTDEEISSSSLIQLFTRESEMMVGLLDAQHRRNLADAAVQYKKYQEELRAQRLEEQKTRDLQRKKPNPSQDEIDELEEEDRKRLERDVKRLEDFVQKHLEPPRDSYDCVLEGYNIDRFCYATFDPTGKLIDAQGSLKIALKHIEQSFLRQSTDGTQEIGEAEADEDGEQADQLTEINRV